MASWSDVRHLEGERARYPRGRDHVSQYHGPRAPGVFGDGWQRRGGLEATLVLPRSHMVALVHQLLLLMEHGVSFKSSCLISWCFVPSLCPNKASQLCIVVTHQQIHSSASVFERLR